MYCMSTSCILSPWRLKGDSYMIVHGVAGFLDHPFAAKQEKRMEKRTRSLPPVLERPSLSRTRTQLHLFIYWCFMVQFFFVSELLPELPDQMPRTQKYLSSLESRADALSFLPEKPTSKSTEGKVSQAVFTRTIFIFLDLDRVVPSWACLWLLKISFACVKGPASEAGATQNEMPQSISPSTGSIGHPEFCRKPCILFKHGHCYKGANCEPLPQRGEWWIYNDIYSYI